MAWNIWPSELQVSPTNAQWSIGWGFSPHQIIRRNMSWLLGREASREKTWGWEGNKSCLYTRCDTQWCIRTNGHNFNEWIQILSNIHWWLFKLLRIYFLKQKYEVFETFKVFKGLVENNLRKKIKSIKYENGGEYVKRDIQQLCVSKGIWMEQLVP